MSNIKLPTNEDEYTEMSDQEMEYDGGMSETTAAIAQGILQPITQIMSNYYMMSMYRMPIMKQPGAAGKAAAVATPRGTPPTPQKQQSPAPQANEYSVFDDDNLSDLL